ncbi:MAG: redoxin domain-containing protein [Bacteroides sp.]|nr:redoxin domain-containing protein [Bacteroides sp.]
MKAIGIWVLLLLATLNSLSQNRIPMLGESAPSFESNTTNGEFVFPEDYGNSWKILFSHPGDFTPVCTSEIMHLAKMQDEFAALGVKIAIISTDDLSTHYQWKQSMEESLRESTGSGNIMFPIIADVNGLISEKYGMLQSFADPIQDVRGVFIIDPFNKVRSINFYPTNVGRNMEEIKRVVVALQTSEKDQVLLPVNWNEGDDVLLRNPPYTEAELKNDPSLENHYYRTGMNLWYKKGK